jgi:hypothetical protein
MVAKGAAGESLTNRAVADLLEHREDDPSNNEGSATIRALPEASDPEDHAFKTAGNTQLMGGAFSFGEEIGPAPPFPVSGPQGPAVQTNTLIANTPSLHVVSTGTFATAEGGEVIIHADGTFLYTPPIGFSGATDSFTYTTDNGLTATVTVTILDRVWYVRNSVGAGGTGQSHAPFNNTWDAESASGPGDAIFIHHGDGATTNQHLGINLQTDQRLIGEGVGLDVPGIGTIVPPGSPPLIAGEWRAPKC